MQRRVYSFSDVPEVQKIKDFTGFQLFSTMQGRVYSFSDVPEVYENQGFHTNSYDFRKCNGEFTVSQMYLQCTKIKDFLGKRRISEISQQRGRCQHLGLRYVPEVYESE